MNTYIEKLAAVYLGNPKKYIDTFAKRTFKGASGWKKMKIRHGEAIGIPGVDGGLKGRTERAYRRLELRDSKKKSPILSGLVDLAFDILTGPQSPRKSY